MLHMRRPVRGLLAVWRDQVMKLKRVSAFAILAVATCLLTGCIRHTTTQNNGPQDTTAKYRLTTLSAKLPPDARVPAVMAAADQTLRSRGYTVVESSATEETGELIAHAPRYNNFPRIVIASSRGVGNTNVSLRVDPFGDQDLCRSVLDGMLQRLGL